MLNPTKAYHRKNQKECSIKLILKMRTIKFKGQCAISKEWITGDLIHGVGYKKGNIYILPNEVNLAYVKHCDALDGVKIITETIGQFIGLKDKKGNEIYEGDKTKDGYVIMWHQEKSLFAEFFYQGFTKKWEVAAFPIDPRNIEIIGNIHETN